VTFNHLSSDYIMIMGSDNVHQHQTGKNKLLSPNKPEKNKLLSPSKPEKTSSIMHCACRLSRK